MTDTRRVFLLHPGLSGHIVPYWELCDEEESIVRRLRAGGIRRAGIVVSFPAPLPAGWAPGRFLASLRSFDSDDPWAEVTDQVEIDLERGLTACPSWLRDRYRIEAAQTETLP